MPNKQYNRGSAFERRIKRELENVGYFVIKAGGSKGPVDLSATSPYGNQLWIQCKKDGRLSNEEGEKLTKLGSDYHTTVLHVSKPKRNEPVRFEYITHAVGSILPKDLGWEER